MVASASELTQKNTPDVSYEDLVNLIGLVEKNNIEEIRKIPPQQLSKLVAMKLTTPGDDKTVPHPIQHSKFFEKDKQYGNVTALHLAAFYGHTEIIALFCSAGADIDAKMYCKDEYYRYTPLCFAVEQQHIPTVNKLMELKANPYVTFHLEKRDTKADLQLTNRHNHVYNLLHLASLNPGPEIYDLVLLLLNIKLSPFSKNSVNNIPSLGYFIRYWNNTSEKGEELLVNLMTLLITKGCGATFDEPFIEQKYYGKGLSEAFHYAIERDFLTVVHLFIDTFQVDVNCSYKKKTPLAFAKELGHTKITEYLAATGRAEEECKAEPYVFYIGHIPIVASNMIQAARILARSGLDGQVTPEPRKIPAPAVTEKKSAQVDTKSSSARTSMHSTHSAEQEQSQTARSADEKSSPPTNIPNAATTASPLIAYTILSEKQPNQAGSTAGQALCAPVAKQAI